MTDISKYKNISIDHDSYKKGRILSKNRLVKDGIISLSKVVSILLNRAASEFKISEEELEKIEITSKKKRKNKKINGKGKHV
jgi:hypothetical protein|tara:strand:+ start:846 stop:1091 length:246 start_codon:yes stop_codon:yes gene_type:complete